MGPKNTNVSDYSTIQQLPTRYVNFLVWVTNHHLLLGKTEIYLFLQYLLLHNIWNVQNHAMFATRVPTKIPYSAVSGIGIYQPFALLKYYLCLQFIWCVEFSICVGTYTERKQSRGCIWEVLGVSLAHWYLSQAALWACSGRGSGTPPGHTQILRLHNLWHTIADLSIDQ